MKFSAQYLIRLDDACPTDKREIWDKLEDAFDRFGIRPIVAVIPECADPSLHLTNYDKKFWSRIKRYRDKGYAIAMHGYKHVYVTKGAGLVPLNAYSEFTGLSLDEQRLKIKAGYQKMLSYGINPTIWIAPGHSFDSTTVVALRLETEIRIISDGLALFPFEEEGFLWIPQQLWWLKKMLFGIWTVCLHPNMMTEESCAHFLTDLELFCSKITTVDEILKKKEYLHRKKTFIDIVFEKIFFMQRNLKMMFIKLTWSTKKERNSSPLLIQKQHNYKDSFSDNKLM
ncbi:MAG: DUF2334 domain-containing protein [Candidatus Brocadia sp.]|nr:DUF2334 domain-containing protein [Candidatus Brocadia sp.]